MSNVIDFVEFKTRQSVSIVTVGDTVEWRDHHGKEIIDRVTGVRYLEVDDTTFTGELFTFPLWDSQDYIVTLESGATILAEIITRKIVKTRQSA